MYILKSKNKKHTVLFDENDILIINNQEIFLKEKVIIVSLMLIISILGIIIEIKNEDLFSIVSFSVLGLVWLIYFFWNVLQKKMPENLAYTDINRIIHIRNKSKLLIFYNQNKSSIRVAVNLLDKDLVGFLQMKGIPINQN